MNNLNSVVGRRTPDPAERIAKALENIHVVLASINSKLDELVKARSTTP